MEPCGIPQGITAEVEVKASMLTQKLLSERYNLNNLRTEPEMPTHCFSLEMRIYSVKSSCQVQQHKWSTVTRVSY